MGSGKCSVGCGKGATFPLVKQSVCNYICADCVQRKCVHRIRSLGDVAWILCVFACVCVCVCVCVFASHLFYRRGKDVDEVEASSSHKLYSGRAAAVGSFD